MATLIEKALEAGIPQTTLVGMLTARGWPEREIYDALAEHYERVTGVEIPQRAPAGASAKEAFLYLLAFSTLATWTISYGYLASTLIDRWLRDPLFTGYQAAFDTYLIPSGLAAILVAYPLYMLISWLIARELSANPERQESGVRKWLTYLALVVAAGVFMGDLITALTYLLRGEVTSRFVAKFLVVLLLSGGVFFYYFSGLRKSEEADVRRTRNRVMAAVSAVCVVLLTICGFSQLGPPRTQRSMRADHQRVQQMAELSNRINGYWNAHGSQLPGSLNDLPGRVVTDPVTHAPYEYVAGQGSEYSLCATFKRNSDGGDDASAAAGADVWVHPAGHYCFRLSATTYTPAPYFPSE
ncbi:MAG: DUF5671 domain-containing protein [Acidobacteriaceae bacterium]